MGKNYLLMYINLFIIYSMPVQRQQIEAVLKGLRNGLEYGSKVRFVHAFVMTLLFRDINLQNLATNLQTIMKIAYEHGRNLGLFVLGYKVGYKVLDKIFGKKSMNHFISGLIFGGIVFGRKKSNVNHQIVLYLLSRVLSGLASLAYKNISISRWSKKELPIPLQRTYGNYLLAAICWGTVMWLFEVDKHCLQPSLRSSMTFLYIQSNSFNKITDLIPFWPKQKQQKHLQQHKQPQKKRQEGHAIKREHS